MRGKVPSALSSKMITFIKQSVKYFYLEIVTFCPIFPHFEEAQLHNINSDFIKNAHFSFNFYIKCTSN